MLSTLLGFINLSYFLVKQCHMQLVGMDFISSLKFLSNWEFGKHFFLLIPGKCCSFTINHKAPYPLPPSTQCVQGHCYPLPSSIKWTEWQCPMLLLPYFLTKTLAEHITVFYGQRWGRRKKKAD